MGPKSWNPYLTILLRNKQIHNLQLHTNVFFPKGQ